MYASIKLYRKSGTCARGSLNPLATASKLIEESPRFSGVFTRACIRAVSHVVAEDTARRQNILGEGDGFHIAQGGMCNERLERLLLRDVKKSHQDSQGLIDLLIILQGAA